MSEIAEPSLFLTPLVIGVTGHRDLVASETDALQRKILDLFDVLREQFPHTPLQLMSALAEGADRLAARAAVSADVDLQVVLPMPAEVYRDDFETIESKTEFDGLCDIAEVLDLSFAGHENITATTSASDCEIAYANAGMFISAHCHILLALWDGRESPNVGGTAQIIYFQHYDRLPGIAESVPRTSLFLTDDESDLVYHLTCSREQSPSGQKALMEPLQAWWFTTDPEAPRMRTMPNRYIRVFERTDEFNADVERLLQERGMSSFQEITAPPASTRAAAERISRYFCVADILADQFQRRVTITLGAIYTFAVLTGLAFMLYSELSGMDVLIFLFLAFLLIGLALAFIARRRQWHRKYLDYRVLAEGLRVQFFWAAAGIHSEGQTKFAYDNFLRQRDMELGWIRNVMRVAGTLGDAGPSAVDAAGLRYAVDHWIGVDSRAGQLDYYSSKASQRARANRVTGALTHLCLWGGIAVAIALAFFLDAIGENMQVPLIVLMGILPLIAGVAETYTQRKADRELTKQYQFMAHVFSNARRRINEAADDDERREVLQGLGDAALSEHAEWILIHRERQPETGQL